MTASEALKACVNALGITNELDEALKNTMLTILTRIQEESEAEEFPARAAVPGRKRGRPRKEEKTDDNTDE